MKNKSKMLCLLMAGMVSMNGMGMLTPQKIWALEDTNASLFEIIEVERRTDTVLKEGDLFDLTITIKTTSEISKSLNNDEVSFSVIGEGVSDSRAKIMNIERAVETTAHVEITLNIDDLMYTGNTPNIKIDLACVQEGENPVWSEQVTYSIPNVEMNGEIQDNLELVSSPTINVVTGESQQIRIELKNTGTTTSREGVVEFYIDEDDRKLAQMIDLNKDEIKVGELGINETKEIVLVLDIDEELPTGSYQLVMDLNGSKQTLQLNVDSDFMPPSLQVNLDYEGVFEANKPKEVVLNVTNVGHVGAKNVTAQFSGESIAVTDGSNVKYIENVASGDTIALPVTLMVSDTTNYTVPLQLELNYIDNKGEAQTSTQTITLATQGEVTEVADQAIGINTIHEPTSTLAIGEEFTVSFEVVAPNQAENVMITVEPTGGIVPKSKNLFVEPMLEEGDKKTYEVKFVAPQEVMTGTYAISITATYELNGEETQIKSYATAFVENIEEEKDEDEEEDEKVISKPVAIVENYSTNPTIVQAGEEFNLDIGFKNTHSTQKITNFKANLTISDQGDNNTGSVFTPVEASNTFFISELAPGQTIDQQITMYTLPNAAPKTYEVTLQMKYTDELGNEITETEYIGIPVEQVTEIEVAEVVTEFVEVGMEADLTATIYNTGKTDISNVMVTVEGEGFDVIDATTYEGVFERGDNIRFNPTLIPYQSGILVGNVIITYEDVSGEESTLTQSFEMEVMEPYVIPDEGNGNENLIYPEEEILEEENNLNWFTLLGGVIGVGSAAGFTSIILKRRRKKLEELAFDED